MEQKLDWGVLTLNLAEESFGPDIDFFTSKEDAFKHASSLLKKEIEVCEEGLDSEEGFEPDMVLDNHNYLVIRVMAEAVSVDGSLAIKEV